MRFLTRKFTLQGYCLDSRLQNVANKFAPDQIIGDQGYRHRIECNLL